MNREHIIRPFRLILPLIVGALLALSARAQEPELVHVRFSTLAWGAAIDDLFYFNEGEPVSILIPNGSPGQEWPYTGLPELIFYTRSFDSENQPIYTPTASVKVSKVSNRLLFVFIEGNEIDKYRILSVSDQYDDFKSNCFNFINLTESPVLIRLDKETISIKQGANQVVSPGDTGSKNIDVQMATNRQGTDWHLIYRSRWASPGNRRAWVFIYEEKADQPKVRKFYQNTSRPLSAVQ